jgi:quinoprotein glucose dehydrogenase
MVRRFLLAPGSHLPCTPPPWGTLAAISPATGDVAWQVPLGQLPSTRNTPGLEKSGSIALGGPIATAGGVIFTAGTLEAAIYAFDARSGAVLWTGSLPTSARSTPMTYLGRDGRQYVVVAAGGHGTPLGPPIGDSLVAFALPRASTR